MTSHLRTVVIAALALTACSSKHVTFVTPDAATSSPGDMAVGDLLPPGPDLSAPTCGNGAIDPNETCDDGNAVSGDGCSSTCQVELGWQCPVVGMACMRQVYCGDGYVEAPETCDDGNSTPGDGCSGTCQLEPNYVCATPTPPPTPPHEVCTSTIICGDGHVEPGEACDDGDTTGLHGCAADCSAVTAGYTCPPAGGACQQSAVADCGNGVVDPGEQCDAGTVNGVSGSGCSSTCTVEPGYTCPTPNQACKRILYCGDGIVTLGLGEQCDDGNTVAGDGCSPTCQLEPNFVCSIPNPPPTPSHQVCVSTVVCDDGKVTGSEQCDDGNSNSGDGCSSTCTLETGWTCPNPDQRCIAKQCGDGVVAGSEKCDTGTQNGVSGSGCSSTCTIVSGYACAIGSNGMTSSCFKTTCGDHLVQGSEQCDDGNLIPFDGCSPTCTNEAKCAGGTCKPVCGDGLVMTVVPTGYTAEQCDDGNTTNGDGCSSTCQIETGWTCSNTAPSPLPTTLSIPILYRDMLYAGTQDGAGNVIGHPDFQSTSALNSCATIYNNSASTFTGYVTGLMNPALGTDSEPAWQSDTGCSGEGANKGTCYPNAPVLTGATDFYWWFHDKSADGKTTNPYDKLVYLDSSGAPLTLLLTETGSNTNTYQFNAPDTSSTPNPQYAGGFFPLDGLGWNAAGSGFTPQVSVGGTDNKNHNFSFTSELHYPFTFSQAQASSSSPAVFTFVGDDYVWAFIGGHLIADLGGVHGAATTTYTLNTTNATALGLKDGGWYSIDVFQAEGYTPGSDYTLTLQGFNSTPSTCTPICGDGKIEGNEVCDNGSTDATTMMPCNTPGTQLPNGDMCVSNNTGDGSAYNGCSSKCSVRGPYCGDGDPNTTPPTSPWTAGPEQCDNGVNLVTYGGLTQQCGPGCVYAPYCGDGVVSNGEQCDDGVNNSNAYGGCTTTCTFGPSCGDGLKNGAEQCDDGNKNGTSGDPCAANCTLLCGNGSLDPGEACDDGSAKNTGGYDGCNSNCTLGPRCGDSIKNGPEQCDNGVNSGAYGTCNPNCTLAAYCGDGVVNGNEQCDQGAANSQNAYGMGKCTNTCQTAPYCGDGIVESHFGEQCDGGSSCNSMCKTTIQ